MPPLVETVASDNGGTSSAFLDVAPFIEVLLRIFCSAGDGLVGMDSLVFDLRGVVEDLRGVVEDLRGEAFVEAVVGFKGDNFLGAVAVAAPKGRRAVLP